MTTRRFLAAILPYFQHVAGLLITGSLGGIVMNTTVVLPAILLGRAIDLARALSEGRTTETQLLWAGSLYVGSMALHQGARVVKRWGLRVANQRMLADIRADAFCGVLGWPMATLSQTPIGDIMARVIGDVQTMGRGVAELTTETWDTVLFSVSLILGMLAYDWRLTLLVLFPVPFGMWLAVSVGRLVVARTRRIRETNAALSAFLQEHLTGLRVIRLFGRTQAIVERAAALSNRLAEANLALVRLRGGLQPVYRVMMLLGVVFLLWLGGVRVTAGTMTLGAFVAYLQLYTRFVGRGHRIPQLFNSIQSATAAYERLEPLLTSPLRERLRLRDTFRTTHVAGLHHGIPNLPARPPNASAVSVQNLTFRYPGHEAPVLNQLNLDIPAGALVAITGPVGCGKSALARALLGLYPLDEGQVCIDTVPLDTLSAVERAARISYLPQTPFLFSGTIRENIVFMRSENDTPSPEAFARYLEIAVLEHDLTTFARGVETEIGERGIRVSGGQRQRIALARAFASASGLLVLDDPFSAVDVDTEVRIVAHLREAFGPAAPVERQATIIFFSHRLAAFPVSDLVVVLDKGRIEEHGTHADLVAAGGLYAHIYRAQQRIEALQ